ncbi:hypothetical protein MLD38_028823 [Melastoma candidum]|uniref:Uncharacterized protein n=1 Tax=Melastoma candidum TaxID=119954 RepID=A0ACB9N4K2_9MYRT|nr:hypothetical protein MLD38_028823 [Melastoma candidum]
MGGLIFGYDIGISGGVTSMPPFLQRFFPRVYQKEASDRSTNQYCKFDSSTLTLFTSSLYLAALLASLVASYVTKKMGRKWSMVLGGFVFLCGALINAVAQNIAMLIIGRILLGFGVGFSIQSVPLWGRRPLFLLGGGIMLVFQCTVAALIGWKFGISGVAAGLPKWYAIVVVICICLYVSAFAFSWGPLGWLVPSEIFPLEIRSAAQSITVCVNMLFTFLVAQVFLAMLCHMKFGLFVFFAFFVGVMTAFIYFFLPETKNKPIEEMTEVWKEHWFWKQFTAEDSQGPFFRLPV